MDHDSNGRPRNSASCKSAATIALTCASGTCWFSNAMLPTTDLVITEVT